MTKFKSNNLPIEKALILNSIIKDAFHELEELFKPEELKGRGIVNHKSSKEKLTKEQDIFLKKFQRHQIKDEIIHGRFGTYVKKDDVGRWVFNRLNDKLDKIELNIKKDEDLTKLTSEYKASKHQEKAIEAMKEYVQGYSSDKDIEDILKSMQSRAKYNGISTDELLESIDQHAENNFAKFSDAAALKKK